MKVIINADKTFADHNKWRFNAPSVKEDQIEPKDTVPYKRDSGLKKNPWTEPESLLFAVPPPFLTKWKFKYSFDIKQVNSNTGKSSCKKLFAFNIMLMQENCILLLKSKQLSGQLLDWHSCKNRLGWTFIPQKPPKTDKSKGIKGSERPDGDQTGTGWPSIHQASHALQGGTIK